MAMRHDLQPVPWPSMLVALAAAALVPWAHSPRFRPAAGWQRGGSGIVDSSYGAVPGAASPKESIAWTAKGVRFRDRRAADPPDATLSHLRRRDILVFAVVYQAARNEQRPIVLRLNRATRYPCCDGTYVAGGEYGLSGSGPRHAYSVIVRVYFGSPPDRSLRAQAQHALDRLELPAPR
jgi:hypothetical protein